MKHIVHKGFRAHRSQIGVEGNVVDDISPFSAERADPLSVIHQRKGRRVGCKHAAWMRAEYRCASWRAQFARQGHGLTHHSGVALVDAVKIAQRDNRAARVVG